MPTTTSDRSATAQLEGKRILITGASSGVGLAAVRLFAAEGARLVLVARRDEELRKAVRSEGIDATVLKADLGERDAAQQAVRDAVQVLGGLDVVVSNAAAAVFGHVLEVHPDDFDRTVHVTFTAAVDVIREALPHLRETQGTIVATGSLMTRVPLPTWSSYASAKHALRGFLNTLRIEEREQGSGVRVAMVHPGPIDTPLFAQASSATGNKPRVPPDAYKPEVIARALVAMAIRPRSEVVLGGETRAIDLLFDSPARPVAEAVLLVVDRWYRSGDEKAIQPGSLWQTGGRPPSLSGGIPSRDSLL
ncbi:MAG: family NAD(P)-dependent oxidoreductase, partial [Solirubrobacterales bacterium]|nr:family NAD(P)-dependent oxidoreductase [Solirubrobacterales bacterium]